MKTTLLLKCILAALIGAGAIQTARAAEAPAEPEKKPVREEVKKMTPEERQARAKQLREKLEKMTPEQREAQRKVWRERLEKRIDELNKKKTEGTLSEDETNRLQHLEQRLKMWTSACWRTSKPSPRTNRRRNRSRNRKRRSKPRCA